MEWGLSVCSLYDIIHFVSSTDCSVFALPQVRTAERKCDN